jgi:cytochrome c peroxidase
MIFLKNIVPLAFLFSLLTACGGGGGDTTKSPNPNPNPNPSPNPVPSSKASVKFSTVTPSEKFVNFTGNNKINVTVQLKDDAGKKLTKGSDKVVLSTSSGSLSKLIDNKDGTYSATLTHTQNNSAVTVSAKVAGKVIVDTARIGFKVTQTTSLTALASLGKKIFEDENLSVPTGQSCASCHDLNSGKTTDTRVANETSEGAKQGVFGGRNTPMVNYSAHTPNQFFLGKRKVGGQFWDGRTDSLEEQARQPFLDKREMNNPNKSSVVTKIKNATYAEDFKTVFGNTSLSNIDKAYVQISEAISAFERSGRFSPFTSRWDKEMADGKMDGNVFNASEIRGFQAFKDGRCDTCHFTPDNLLGAQVFTNFEYENIGVPKNPTNPLLIADTTFIDFGAGSAPDDPEKGPHNVSPPGTGKGMFKVPSLRNIAKTAPYMHNGIFSSLNQVIDFYNADSVNGIDTTAEVGDTISDGGQYFTVLFENPQEKSDLKAFLEALTDEGL